jgi:large subunit ribosomal protein L29
MATIKELRELSADELIARATELKQSLFELKTKHATGVLDSTAALMEMRRDVARCLTIAREKQGQAAPAGKKE